MVIIANNIQAFEQHQKKNKKRKQCTDYKQNQKNKKRKQYTHSQTHSKEEETQTVHTDSNNSKEEEEPHSIHKHLNTITRRRRHANNAQSVKQNRTQKKNRK